MLFRSAPAKSFKDLMTTEAIVGASNPGATTYDLPAVMNSVLGTKFRIVTGYPGSREITLAIERGETQGTCGLGWTGFVNFYPEWFSKGFIKVIAQVSLTGHPDLDKQGVPKATDFAKTDDDRLVLELVFKKSKLSEKRTATATSAKAAIHKNHENALFRRRG